MATTRRVTKTRPEPPQPSNVVSQIELVDFFHRKAVLVEIGPALYRLEALIAWRAGRSTLMGARGTRQFRSLDTLVRHLRTSGAGRTVTRLELRA